MPEGACLQTLGDHARESVAAQEERSIVARSKVRGSNWYSASGRVGRIEFVRVEFREQAGWDQGLDTSYVVIHEIRPDGLVRALTNAPIGWLEVGDEFVSPPPSTAPRQTAAVIERRSSNQNSAL